MHSIIAIEQINNLSSNTERVQRKILRDKMNPFEMYTCEEFLLRYRFTKDTTIYLCDLLREKLTRPTQRHDPVPVEFQILSALRFYATGSFQMVIGDHLSLSQSFISKTVARISMELASLRQDFIFMPDQHEATEVHEKFYNIAQFPQVIGAIDGTHIPIRNPGGLNAQRYINRKGFYSINAQIVCDATNKIRSIVARWPGSSHDSRIFHESRLKEKFENGELTGLLLGDNGYPCTKYLFTPVLHPQTSEERRYNRSHILTRGIVERTFGILKRRFPCLHFPLRTKLENSYAIIIAVAVLHNIAVHHREPDLPHEIEMIEINSGYEILDTDQSNGIMFRQHLINTHFTG